MNRTLILIEGHPCTGKTRLARALSAELALPCISRDEFKELLFDELGIRDREWSMRLGRASYELLFATLEKFFQTGASLIVESNFNPAQHRERVQALLNRHRYSATEILLEANSETLLSRFRNRWESGERHRGHVDHEGYEELAIRLSQEPLEPLGVGASLLRIDTSRWEQLDPSAIARQLATTPYRA